MGTDDTPYHERADQASDDDDRDDDDEPGVFPYEWAAWGGWGIEWPYRSGADTEDRPVRDATYTDTDDSWWDESLIGLVLVVGAVLFVIPEPSTTALGILLLAIGVVAWFLDPS